MGRKGVRSLLRISGALTALAVLAPSASAQVTTADLEGIVTDDREAGIAGARVSVVSVTTGVVRETVSAANGRYRVAALDPAAYDVTVQADGYGAEVRKNVVPELGRVARVDFRLAPQVGVAATIEVVAKVPLVQTAESAVPTVVSEAEIDSLPLNSRNVAELALLAPGVSAFRGSTPPFSPLNLGAANSRGTRAFVDGMDFSSDMLGGFLPVGIGASQSAVEQFEVMTSGFKAEYGFTTAGAISLITKSGANELHGSAFAFLRDKALNSGSYAEDEEYQRQQYGVALGGPISRDRTHYFVALEGNHERATATVFTGGAFPEVEGAFPRPSRSLSLVGKLDHQLSPAQSLGVRLFLTSSESSGAFGGSLAQSTGQEIKGAQGALLASHTWMASDRALSETALGVVSNEFDIVPYDSGPHLVYPSAEMGRWPGGEQHLDELRWNLRSTLSYFVPTARGQHFWKVGADLSRVRTKEFYDSLSTGLFIFGSDSAPLPFLAVIGDGNPDYPEIVNHRLGLFIQDDWSVLDNLTLNLGLRYDVETNATNQDYFSSKTDPALPYIVHGDRPVDGNNVAPRLGFAWDPLRDGKTAVRGSWGIYYGRVPSDFANGEIKSDQYRTYLVFGPGTTDKEEIDLEGLPYQIEWLLPERVPMPYSTQLDLGVSRELGADFAIDVDYVAIRGHNEYFARNDVNTPNPDYSRPLPQYLEVFVMRTDGRSRLDALEVALRKRLGGGHDIRVAYTLSKAENDFDEPHFAGQLFKWGPAGWDERSRLTAAGIFSLPYGFQTSCIVTLASGRPFNVYTGDDANRNGDLTDDQPPGVGRNSERGKGYSSVDLRVSKTFALGGSQLAAIVEVFNLFNKDNVDPASYVGNMQSPLFGTPTASLAPRQVQLGVSLTF
jgi:hypothetical protein